MHETKTGRMERLSREMLKRVAGRRIERRRALSAPPIDRIADQGVADMRRVHADLMGAAGLKSAGEAGRNAAALAGKPFIDVKVGDRTPAGGDNGHAGAVRGVPVDPRLNPEPPLDQPARMTRMGRVRDAVANRHVATIDTVIGELFREPCLRAVGFRHDEQPAGILVNAMDDTRTRSPADPGQSVAAVVQEGVH